MPLGGNKTRIFSIWFIFGFVALWHEISFNWLLFGVMNAAGVAIESILVVIVYDKQKVR
jgi:D-alanyl-lipoteichoic acid acyltransferase DltB (MBOAT superfamily)